MRRQYPPPKLADRLTPERLAEVQALRDKPLASWTANDVRLAARLMVELLAELPAPQDE